jgi:hypothetical protein
VVSSVGFNTINERVRDEVKQQLSLSDARFLQYLICVQLEALEEYLGQIDEEYGAIEEGWLNQFSAMNEWERVDVFQRWEKLGRYLPGVTTVTSRRLQTPKY